MKKIFSLLMVFLLAAGIFAGCKGKNSNASDSDDKQTTASETQNKKNDDKKSGDDVKVDVGGSVKLPAKYPKDLIPLIGDAKITMAMEDTKNNTFTAAYTTKKTYKAAVDFYREALKDSENYVESDSGEANGFLFMGSKGGYSYAVTIGKDDKGNMNVGIMLGNEKSISSNNNNNNNTDNGDKQSYYDTSKEVALIDNYPLDKYPVMKGDKVTAATYAQNNGQDTFYITVVSKKTLKEAVTYYETNWGKIENKIKEISNEDFVLAGDIGENNFWIGGNIKDDSAKTVEYVITLNIVKSE